MDYNLDLTWKFCTFGCWKGPGYPRHHACAGLLAAHPEVGMEVYCYFDEDFGTFEYRKCFTGSITVPALPGPSTIIPANAD